FLASRKLNQLFRFASVEITRDPLRLFAFNAELIKLIARALKNKKPVPKLLELLQKFFVDRERVRREKPIFLSEQPFFREGITNGRELVVLNLHRVENSQLSTVNTQLSASRHLLQRQFHEFFRRFRLALQIADRFVGIDLFVAKRNQRQHGLVRLFLL